MHLLTQTINATEEDQGGGDIQKEERRKLVKDNDDESIDSNACVLRMINDDISVHSFNNAPTSI